MCCFEIWVLTVKFNGFFNLEMERYFKVIINCYNKENSLPNSIIFLIEDIRGLAHTLYILSFLKMLKNLRLKIRATLMEVVKNGVSNVILQS